MKLRRVQLVSACGEMMSKEKKICDAAAPAHLTPPPLHHTIPLADLSFSAWERGNVGGGEIYKSPPPHPSALSRLHCRISFHQRLCDEFLGSPEGKLQLLRRRRIGRFIRCSVQVLAEAEMFLISQMGVG